MPTPSPRRLLAAFAAVTALGTVALATGAGAAATTASGTTVPTYATYSTTKAADPNALGADSGEPSIGVNWKTGRVLYQSRLQTLQVTFDDKRVPATASYKDVSNPLTGANTLDPILFTDSPPAGPSCPS